MSGHVVQFPPPCVWCRQPAYPGATCPATIRCPRCKADAGERCRQPNGHARADLHRERHLLALDLDDA